MKLLYALLLMKVAALNAVDQKTAFPLDPLSKVTVEANDAGKKFLIPAAMVLVPAGTFVFGNGEAAIKATLPSFAIGKYSVTNAEYKAFVDATGSKAPAHWSKGTFPEGKGNHPVVNISLTAAKAYAAWASKSSGFQYAIPTSQQWEKAARGPKSGIYPWGDSSEVRYRDGVLQTRFNFNGVIASKLLKESPDRKTTYNNPKSTHFGEEIALKEIASYDGEKTTHLSVEANGSVRGWVGHDTYTGFIYTAIFTDLNEVGGNTTPVGTYEEGKSFYGCYDMAGNAWNWCDTLIVAKNGAEKGREVNEIRGGSWYATSMSCKSISIGEGRAASGAYNTVGFRLVAKLGE
jgi:formylglycine-generating enzyme required for sulfatase activity